MADPQPEKGLDPAERRELNPTPTLGYLELVIPWHEKELQSCRGGPLGWNSVFLQKLRFSAFVTAENYNWIIIGDTVLG